jgi:signal transduction histidine kinase
MSRTLIAIARVRGSVRARVALAAAAVFALTLGLGSVVLLRTVETRLVDDVSDSAQRTLQEQAVQVLSGDVIMASPTGAVKVGDNTIAFQLPDAGGQPVVAALDTLTADSETTGSGNSGPAAIGSGSGADLIPIVTTTRGGTAGVLLEGVVSSGGSTAEYQLNTPIDAQSAQMFGVATAEPIMVSTLQVNPGLSLATASSLSEVNVTLDTTRQVLWWAVPLLVALVGALAWAIAGRALRPVHAITSQVATINRESLHERVPAPRSRDEVCELATTMNSMLDRLERSSDSNRRLVSDAAHELRTPIAVIRADLEVAQRSSAIADWSQVSDRVLAETDRLQQLIDDLLLLSRLDERRPATSLTSVDDLVRDVAGRRRRVDIELGELAPATDIDVDVDATRRALDHVVANAARHADSTVAISVDVTSGANPMVSIAVDDDGPGIPLADRDRVIERFVRLDEGRSRDAGGSGLGLAVVSDVMAAHGGDLIIGDSHLGGACVTLHFPLAQRQVLTRA